MGHGVLAFGFWIAAVLPGRFNPTFCVDRPAPCAGSARRCGAGWNGAVLARRWGRGRRRLATTNALCVARPRVHAAIGSGRLRFDVEPEAFFLDGPVPEAAMDCGEH